MLYASRKEPYYAYFDTVRVFPAKVVKDFFDLYLAKTCPQSPYHTTYMWHCIRNKLKPTSFIISTY